MKKLGCMTAIVCFILSLAPALCARAAGVKINDDNFPSMYFQQYLRLNVDKNRDGVLSKKEREAVREIDVGERSEYQLEYEYPPAGSMEGIEYFPNLERLDCSESGLSELDISHNPKLKRLDCTYNDLTHLDLSRNKNLEYLYFGYNKIKTIRTGGCKKLKRLLCDANGMKEIDLSKNREMTMVSIEDNKIKKIKVSHMRNLEDLYIGGNKIKKIDVSKNPKLKEFYCGNNNIKTLNLKNNKKLTILSCWENKLRHLNLKNNKLLEAISCDNNRLVTGNLNIGYKQLEGLDDSPQKLTVKVKKIGRYYYVPLKGVNKTNVITRLSTGTITEKGIRLKGKKIPDKITYQYNMFTDGKNKTKVIIKVKR